MIITVVVGYFPVLLLVWPVALLVVAVAAVAFGRRAGKVLASGLKEDQRKLRVALRGWRRSASSFSESAT